MAVLDPSKTTVGDLCIEALKECGRVGVGQVAQIQDINDAWLRLQWMLQEWTRKRWLIYHLVDLSVVSTGAPFYTVGPGGDIDTGAGGSRPNRLESCFVRQLISSSPNTVDYPCEILQSMEDYSKLRLKNLVSFPGAMFLDTAWPQGKLYPYPIPQANIYEIHIQVRAQLPVAFLTLATYINLPYEYYSVMHFNLAVRLALRFQMPLQPGLVAAQKESLATLRAGNFQIARLGMPTELTRPGIYSVFSDQNY